MTHILEADSIRLAFNNRTILHDIYIAGKTGSIIGLMGRNGTGKSSLLQIIFGTRNVEGKSVRFDRQSKNTAFQEPNLINYLPQFHFIPGSFTLAKVLYDYSLSFTELMRVFPEFTLHYKTKMRALDGGSRRLIEVYCIISKDSYFSILDEPFSQLSPLNIEKVLSLIQRYKAEKGFLITDQQYKPIISISDQLYVLTNGKTYKVNALEDLEYLGYLTSSQIATLTDSKFK